ncbi:uncharacterized protein LOC135432377 [Drosophila montana]|uniref:uncharacterized protein LOC135432377 n=1 Tax=Drosophila montana TaxID=40370 RepID=UPI00313D1132
MMFNNCSCSSDDPEKLLTHLNCSLGRSWRRRTFSIELKFRQPVPKFLVNMASVLPRVNGQDFTLFNLSDINGCQLLANKNQIPFIQLGRHTMESFSNVPKRCPFPKDELIYVRSYRSNMQNIPAFSFESDMHIYFAVLVNGNKIIKGFIQSRVQRHRSGKRDQLL